MHTDQGWRVEELPQVNVNMLSHARMLSRATTESKYSRQLLHERKKVELGNQRGKRFKVAVGVVLLKSAWGAFSACHNTGIRCERGDKRRRFRCETGSLRIAR
jgi:hypothetical protein